MLVCYAGHRSTDFNHYHYRSGNQNPILLPPKLVSNKQKKASLSNNYLAKIWINTYLRLKNLLLTYMNASAQVCIHPLGNIDF